MNKLLLYSITTYCYFLLFGMGNKNSLCNIMFVIKANRRDKCTGALYGCIHKAL